jgi:hypothetical protein
MARRENSQAASDAVDQMSVRPVADLAVTVVQRYLGV